jgi:alpha-amylase/alpha-mannosidase (GH57 family)
MTRVAILWHMHQPYYEDLLTGDHVLPWVRMHALKDYYGMVALAREFPGLRLTFNLVPSLAVQLEAFADGRARDHHLHLSLKPAGSLTAPERAFLLANSFHAQRQRMIHPYPRYAELLERRDRAGDAHSEEEWERVAACFDDQDFRDLQVWQKLAWIDPFYQEKDPRTGALFRKEANFTEADKLLLHEVELELIRNVIPEYRHAAHAGQVELSTSPFYHPILPLLCNTDVYLETHRDCGLEPQLFQHPEDASMQLRKAVEYHRRLFGQAPRGLWPSEGSVSEAIVPLVAEAGFEWMGTDEQMLARSLGATFSRDGHGHLEQPELLYRPYRVRAGGREVACIFRDHVLSDQIGFCYSSWAPDAAANDLVHRIVEAGRRFSGRTGGEEAVVAIMLDGENAWEHFEGGGRPFLRALYGQLTSHPELRTVTMAEAAAGAMRTLDRLAAGSWVDGGFYIWIGHPDDQRAWRQIAEARRAIEDADAGLDVDAKAQAWEELLVAEGSDWFWWYGDDHSSEHDQEFDELFRRHVQNVYRALGRPVPEELFTSNISNGRNRPETVPPAGPLNPSLDGRAAPEEWADAGYALMKPAYGTMHRASDDEALVSGISYGTDGRNLFLRLRCRGAAADLLAEGVVLGVRFPASQRRRLEVRQGEAAVAAALFEACDGLGWVRCDTRPVRVVAGEVLELAVPLADLGGFGNGPLRFFVTASRGGQELERYPCRGPIELSW